MDFDRLKTSRIEWDDLESLVASGHLYLSDLELSKLLIGKAYKEKSDMAALICHLSSAVRQGHLCIDAAGGRVMPDVMSLWTDPRSEGTQVESSLTENILERIESSILRASRHLPETLVTSIEISEAPCRNPSLSTPLCRMGNRIYFQRYWYYETLFLYHFRRFTEIPAKIVIDKKAVTAKLEMSDTGKALLPEQKEAILNACENSLTLICGGPGTGKTHTAGVLICTLWDALSEEEREKFEISLAAPTGKAAANLRKSLLKSAKGIEKLSTLQSKTLHGLLGVKNTLSIEEIRRLSSDLVIVDECSMIDVRLMAALFAAMKPGSRLILLGDPHQLPAVEAGSVFADFVQAGLGDKGHSFQVGKLNKCLRSELREILEIAASINEGNAENVFDLLSRSDAESVRRLNVNSVDNDRVIVKELITYAFDCFRFDELTRLTSTSTNVEHSNAIKLLDHFNRFRILSPLRQGPFGVEEINHLIGTACRASFRRGSTGPYIAPVMLLKNDYRLELFNGEVGVLVKHRYDEEPANLEFSLAKGDYALFMGKDDQVRVIPALLLPAFEYAYCLSVHKSQGSEFDHLLMLVPPGSENFGRELIYTGVTRARRQLTLWADDTALKKAIEYKSERLSGVIDRL